MTLLHVYMDFLLVFCLSFLVTVTGEIPNPVILTTPKTVEAYTGDTIVFDCAVENLENKQVVWTYLDHMNQISQGNTVSHNPERFSIVRPEGTPDDHWNLQISSVQHLDSGQYKCQIGRTSTAITHTLVISDAPPRPTPSITPRVNFTDCCVKEGVSRNCIPACNPSTIDTTTFDPIASCALDLGKLLKCGSDGRNHIPCCRRRFVPDQCLDFCANGLPSTLDLTSCMASIEAISECFEEGHALLPGPPTQVTGSATASSQIYVKWELPIENADTVVGYKVSYKMDNEPVYRSSGVVSGRFYTIQHLPPVTKIMFYVQSINTHGSSLQSEIIEVSTSAIDGEFPVEAGKNLADCCIKRRVKNHCVRPLCGGINLPPHYHDPRILECFTEVNKIVACMGDCCRYKLVDGKCIQPLCGGAPTTESLDDDLISCFSQVDRVFQCMAGEADHSRCCRDRGIPDNCLGFCKGSIIPRQWNTQLQCFDFMPDIASCFQENMDSLPSAPLNIRLEHVSSNMALISWDPPSRNANQVRNYEVKYREEVIETYTKKLVTGTRIRLEDLKESTMYEVTVQSVATTASSLPSPTLYFLTYYSAGSIAETTLPPMSTTVPEPHDIQACCKQAGVKDICLQLCDYSLTITSLTDPALLQCLDDLNKMLSCATDGRNHELCCKQKLVSEDCIGLCSYDETKAQDETYLPSKLGCISQLQPVVRCMADGISTLPSYPIHFRVQEKTPYTIGVSWQQPYQIPDGHPIVGYEVHWQLSELGRDSMEFVKTNMTSFIIQNLRPDMEYLMQVTAYNDQGYSLPSDGIKARTLQDPADIGLVLNLTLPADLTECCQSKNISSKCLPACNGTGVVTLDECMSDLGRMIECAADNKDHRPCCTRNNVPSHCHGFCMGKPVVSDFSSTLCVAWTDQILTCFREGISSLPSPPVNFHLREVEENHVEFGWEKAPTNSDDVRYTLYYKTVDESNYKYVENVVSPYKVEDLLSFVYYEFFMVAVNGVGSSVPTMTYEILTKMRETPIITITQDPKGYISLKKKVKLSCKAVGDPTPTSEWIHDGQVTKEKDIVIEEVDEHSGGKYTCRAATPSGASSSADIFLKIQYSPTVTVIETLVEVEPKKGLPAKLQCDFKGYPDHLEWYKAGEQLQEDLHYQMTKLVNEDEGIVHSILTVQIVRQADYARYLCRGRNSLGRKDGFITLKDPNDRPGNTAPTVTPGKAVKNVTACCIEKKVNDLCLPACTFDVDLTVLARLPNPLQCVADMEKMIQCSADGRNHTRCCSQKEIPDFCIPLCAGSVPVSGDLYGCLGHIEVMIDCMQEGHVNIPSQPRNVQGHLNVEGYIEVKWTQPLSHPEMATYYEIFFNNSDTQMTTTVTPKNNKLVALLDEVHGFTTYKIFVKAGNHHGTSLHSNIISVPTNELAPTKPRDLMSHLVSDTYVKLNWAIPLKHPGAVLYYNVHHRIVGEKQYLVSISRTTSYNLLALQLGKKYEVYVTAKSSHYESAMSNSVIIETPKDPNAGKIKTPGGPSKVGIGIGVFFVLAVLVGVVIMGVYYIFRVRKSAPQRFKDTVSFENPGYASAGEAKVSGLPGEPNTKKDLNLQQQKAPEKPPNNSSIMRESSVPAMDTQANMYEKTGNSEDPNHQYATINATQMAPADKNNVHISVEHDA